MYNKEAPGFRPAPRVMRWSLMAPYDVASTIRQALWSGVTCGDVNECAARAYTRPLVH